VNYQSAESSRVESSRKAKEERGQRGEGRGLSLPDIPAGREGPQGSLNDVSG
jgi:hypothetical protein